jgi:hypothetical protein
MASAPQALDVKRLPRVDAETRGKRRIWMQLASARFDRAMRAFDSPEVAKAGLSFSKASRSHRMGAYLVLERAFKDNA